MKDTVKTILVNLNSSEEELLKNLHKNARWGINRAKKEGLIVKKKKGFKDFYKIYLNSMKEKNISPAYPKIMKDNSIEILICFKGEKVIAGLILSKDKDRNCPEIEFNSSEGEFQKYQPNDLLYWEAILWAKEKGYDKLNLGGYSIKPWGEKIGINKFKEKFSKNIISYEENFPLDLAIQRKILRTIPLVRKIKDRLRLWKNKKNKVYEKALKELEKI